MDVRVRLLGRFELTCDGQVAIDGAWKPAKAAAIVKMLALREGRSMHRDQLIDALWPDADVEAGTNSLYKSLHQLRQTVRRAGGPRDIIHLDHPLISLAPYVQVDLDEYRQRVAQISDGSTREELAEALALGGEMLLPEDPYEAWTEPHRREIQLLTTRLRMRLAKMQLDAAAFEEAAEQYRAVLLTDDLAEEAHLGLMRAYVGAERPDLALRQYERCKESLASELGTAPSEETEAFVAELRRANIRSQAAEGIDEPVREGDAAMRRYAWSDAGERYQEAIKRIQATEPDDEREAEIWLKLANATKAVGPSIEVAEHCRRAAALAERAGAFELRARALMEFQDATDVAPENHVGHRESAELISQALADGPPEPSAGRALLLAASARALSASARPDNERHVTGRLSVAGGQNAAIEERLREAVAMARAIGRSDIVGNTLSRLRLYITSPDTLEERLAISTEMMELNTSTRPAFGEYQARLLLHEDLLESGDLDGARIQARAMRRLGEAMRADGIVVVAGSLLATHATADGELREGKKLLFESNALDARQGTTSNTRTRFGIQLLMLRWHEGRIAEMYEPYRREVDVMPRVAGTRAALSLICAETGRLDEARAELDVLNAKPVTEIAKDYQWWLTTVSMSRVAVATGAAEVAANLYALLLPYAERNASTAGAVSWGSASLYLGQLAALLGSYAEAEKHFEAALAFNIRTRQRVWTPRVRLHYAEMLLARGAEGDAERARELVRVGLGDAREIGMGALAEQLSAAPFA